MKINIIGDIAGRYDELMLLLSKMPEADLIIAVGDLVDRGPKSKEVIEWFMSNSSKAVAIYGNHEDMMVNYHRDPEDWNSRYMWLRNGGQSTLKSFSSPDGSQEEVPEAMLQWLEQLPLWWTNDELIVSHAPINYDLDDLPDQFSRHNIHYFIWNRCVPYKRLGNKFHVYGHNGEHRSHSDLDGEYGFCIDNSWHGELTGMHWPTREIFKQEFIREESKELTEEQKKALEMLSYSLV